MADLTSVIFTACNQGDWLRQTIGEARESLGDTPHEIIVVDDHSTDRCCHGLPPSVIIVRPDYRLGVSGARRFGAERADGDVLLWSDPHCYYPDHALSTVVEVARNNWAVVQPPSRRKGNRKEGSIAWGGKIVKNERGLAMGKAARGYRWPALINTVYCCRREVYEAFGGWPHLPGSWGYSEQAMSLLLWRAAIPILIAPSAVCTHLNYHIDGRLPFRVTTQERAINGHLVHAVFCPSTYESQWRPVLLAKYREEVACDEALKGAEVDRLTSHLQSVAVRGEFDFYRLVLGVDTGPLSDTAYVDQQRARSDAMGYGVNVQRLERSLQWFVGAIPGCINGRSVLDVGTRDGALLEVLKTMGARHVEGIELLPEVAAIGIEKRRIVRTADMRKLPDPDGQWDVVTCLHTLEHVPEPDVALAELARVMRPGGWLLVVVPREDSPVGEHAHNFAVPDRKSLGRLLRSIDTFDGATCVTHATGLRRETPEIMGAIRKSK